MAQLGVRFSRSGGFFGVLAPALLALVLPAAAADQRATSPSGPGGSPEETAARLLGIHERDDRIMIERMTAPWTAIGRVNRGGGGFCSGTLIAANKVLTAAHCVWDRRTAGWAHPSNLHFQAGYHLGQHVAYRSVRAVKVADGIAMTINGSPRKKSQDWAVLTLDRPIPSGPTIAPIPLAGPADIAAVAGGAALVRAGYSQDRSHALAYVDCRALGVTNGTILMNDCDATLGDSGSPVMIRSPQGLKLVGVQTASAQAKRKSVGIAVLLDVIPKRAIGR